MIRVSALLEERTAADAYLGIAGAITEQREHLCCPESDDGRSVGTSFLERRLGQRRIINYEENPRCMWLWSWTALTVAKRIW